MVRALDIAARPAASAVLEDENLTRLILGSLNEEWEWRGGGLAHGARALLRATATCKRWHNMDLTCAWKKLVQSRWPAAAKLGVQDFKRFYRSHHSGIFHYGKSYTPDWEAVASQDPADIQFVVDMGIGSSGECSILSVVLDGSEASCLDEALFYNEPPHFNYADGLGWTVDPLFDEMRARIHRQCSLRDAFRDAFLGEELFLTLTAFRKSDQVSCVLIDCTAVGKMHSGAKLGIEDNRVAFEMHADPLAGGEMRPYKCTATFGYNFSWDGDADAEPSWVFGFDIHKVGDEEDRLDTPHMWKALTLLEWK